MSRVNQPNRIPRTHEITIRVRYQETDAQGRVHHSNYANYFEIGRVEMLRSAGRNYRDLEKSGLMLVVVELGCRYHGAAQYDDLLTLKSTVIRAKGARITHHYELYLEEILVAEGKTVVAAVDPSGNVVRLPKWLQLD